MANVLPLKFATTDFSNFQSGDTLGSTYGGTGLSSFTSGSLLYGSAPNVWNNLGIGTANQVLITNAAGTFPAWSSIAIGMPVIVSLTNTTGGAITKGQVVYISGTGTVGLANANVQTNVTRAIGLVYDASISNNTAGNIIVAGILTGVLAAATAGNNVFLSDAVAGNIVNTAPSTVGHSIVKLGHAVNATDLLLSLQEPIFL